MCKYNITIEDEVMNRVRPTITAGMSEDAWVQIQVQAFFAQMAAKYSEDKEARPRISQRLRGIGRAPEDFDYKKELEGRYQL